MSKSLGIIEVIGYNDAIKIIDMMSKMAYIEVEKIEYIGDGLLAILVSGDVESVKVALEIAEETILNGYGKFLSTHIITRPYFEV